MPVILAPQYTRRDHSWASWKVVDAVKGTPHQYDDDGVVYTIWFYDGPEVHVCTIYLGDVPTCIIEAGYSQAQNDTDKAEFDDKYKTTANKPLVSEDSRCLPRVVIEKADTSKVTLFSHDWCDKTTWYEAAIRIVDEVATDSGDHLTYTLAHAYVVDMYHGKVTGEDFLKDAGAFSFRVAVKVDNVAKVEQNPHTGTGGDYTINYVAGTLTFLSSTTGEVKVTYHYATSSVFTIRPAPEKLLSLEMAECQFSADVEITDSVKFQAYGWCIAFAPQLAESNGGPYPDTTLLPLGNPTLYKGMRDYLNEAVRAYVKYPSMGGSSWRGVDFDTVIFDWDYARATAIRSSMGMEVRISLEHDLPFGGKMATATFYCSSEKE